MIAEPGAGSAEVALSSDLNRPRDDNSDKAHVAWQSIRPDRNRNAYRRLRHCTITGRATQCDRGSVKTLFPDPGIRNSTVTSANHIHIFAMPGTRTFEKIVVVASLSAENNRRLLPSGGGWYAFTSTNGGRTFTRRKIAHGYRLTQVAPGPGDAISLAGRLVDQRPQVEAYLHAPLFGRQPGRRRPSRPPYARLRTTVSDANRTTAGDRVAAGALSPPPPGQDVDRSEFVPLVVRSNGTRTSAFTQFNVHTGSGSFNRSSSWGGPANLTPGGTPALAVGGDSGLATVYQQPTGTGASLLRSARIGPGGVPGPPATIPTSGSVTAFNAQAVWRGGLVWVVFVEGGEIKATPSFDGGASWPFTPGVIVPSNQRESSDQPEIAGDVGGDVLVVWDGPANRILAARP